MIYLNETPKGKDGDFPVNPCLVVEGEVEGIGTRYYRIDFGEIADDKYVYRDNYATTLRYTDHGYLHRRFFNGR